MSGANIGGAVLSESNLTGAFFRKSDLRWSILLGVTAVGADFSDAGFLESRLSFSNFTNANFSRSDLRRSDLTDAIFVASDFSEANMARVDLRHSDITRANFQNANMLGLKLPENTSISFCDDSD